MPKAEFADLSSLAAAVGTEVVVGEWSRVSQREIDAFADLTGDRQWIHCDAERARRDSPYGLTVAHAFLSLALLSGELQNLVRVDGVRLALIYGLNKVRFPAPLPEGSHIRSRVTLAGLAGHAAGCDASWAVSVEREGEDKPVCVAEVVVRYLS